MEPPPPYTLTRDSSVRPKRRTLFVDGQARHLDSAHNDIMQSYVIHQEDKLDRPLRKTVESQTFHFYGKNTNIELDDGTGGEVRVQSFPVDVDNLRCSPSCSEELAPARTSISTNNTAASPRAAAPHDTKTQKTASSPYAYPPGYVCLKCKNTGVVGKRRKVCANCFNQFSTQRVHYNNPVVQAASKLTRGQTRWVDNGDGNCSKCLGTGKKHNTLKSGVCPLCDGSGVWPR